MKAFDWQLQMRGYIPMSGQIVDASLVPAPKQRNSDGEKVAIKEGKTAQEIWPDQPAKAAQKDTKARWPLKVGGKIRYRPDGIPLPQIALPVFAYKSHIAIDRRYGFIREAASIAANHTANRCPTRHPAQMAGSQRSVRAWSMSSPTRKADTGYLSARSVWPALKPNCRSQTLPTTSTV